jgi:hypothetical protein
MGLGISARGTGVRDSMLEYILEINESGSLSLYGFNDKSDDFRECLNCYCLCLFLFLYLDSHIRHDFL